MAETGKPAGRQTHFHHKKPHTAAQEVVFYAAKGCLSHRKRRPSVNTKDIKAPRFNGKTAPFQPFFGQKQAPLIAHVGIVLKHHLATQTVTFAHDLTAYFSRRHNYF